MAPTFIKYAFYLNQAKGTEVNLQKQSFFVHNAFLVSKYGFLDATNALLVPTNAFLFATNAFLDTISFCWYQTCFLPKNVLVVQKSILGVSTNTFFAAMGEFPVGGICTFVSLNESKRMLKCFSFKELVKTTVILTPGRRVSQGGFELHRVHISGKILK